MKSFVSMLTVLTLSLALIGCSQTVSCPAAPDLGVTLTAKDVNSAGMTLVFTQSGGEACGELNTGDWYQIEVSTDGDWVPVEYAIEDDDVAWNSLAWIIPMENTVEWDVNWEWLYGELPAGQYRIAKEIVDFRKAGDFDKTLSYAEFTLE